MDTREKILNKYETLKDKTYLMRRILDGTRIAEHMKEDLAIKTDISGIKLKLTLIQVGYDYASEKYFKSIESNCELFNIDFSLISFREDIEQRELEGRIKELVNYKGGSIMIHTPLPKHIDINKLYDYLNTSNDVDCVTKNNLFKIFDNNSKIDILPCTVQAVLSMIFYYNIEVVGKKVLILGRSMTVGKPLATVLERKNATVTICHSKTPEHLLIDELKRADIIISAVGQAKFITSEMIGSNQTLIDVGINFDENGKMCGDIDFENVIEQCRLITPVPFGVGTVTSMCLIDNIIKCKEMSRKWLKITTLN